MYHGNKTPRDLLREDSLRIGWLLGVLRVDAFEAGGLVASRQLIIRDGDNGKTLRRAEARTVPPVAADGSARDVRNALPNDHFIDVSMALQHPKHVMSAEEIENLVGIGDAEAVMR